MTDPLIRDCFQQVKTIHHLILRLQDDLGDLSMSKGQHSLELAKMCDRVIELEPELQKMRARLDELSR